MLVKDLHQRLFLGMGPANWLSLQSIVSLTVGESYGLLMVDCVYYRSVAVKGVANMKKIMGLNLVGESGSEVRQGKPSLAVASNQTT